MAAMDWLLLLRVLPLETGQLGLLILGWLKQVRHHSILCYYDRKSLLIAFLIRFFNYKLKME